MAPLSLGSDLLLVQDVWRNNPARENQLRARLVFENDGVTNIAHQLGFFQTVAGLELYATLFHRIAEVTLDQVAQVAGKYLASANRTAGWFEPQPPGSGTAANDVTGVAGGPRAEAA